MGLDKILEITGNYLTKIEIHHLKKAYEFAKKAHEGQKRKSGEPYIHHPLEAATILAKMHADSSTLIAAILHDVPEDTKTTLNEIKNLFGDEVKYLVDGITKISAVHYRTDMEERQTDALKKLLIHSAQDNRVILIKLADRLHNMRTLSYIENPAKRERIARETMEIYIPIANLFGLGELKSEMEDLCFKELNTEKFNQLQENLGKKDKIHKKLLDLSIEKINKILKENKIEAEINGRKKSLYSIYKKIIDHNYSLKEVEDIIGIRIITKNINECYLTLGIIHQIFKPKPRRIKDYIAVPKANGYQSIHTTVFGIEGIITEIQIRTERMDLEAELGIAAHYFYKEKNGEENNTKNFDWSKKILEIQKTAKDSHELIQKLKLDVFQDRIFTFTPKGDVIDLPQGATAIDFAYAIHSEIGNKAEGAEINGEKTSILSTLYTGDIIQIITNPDRNYPETGWINFARTNTAKKNIKDALKKQTTINKLKAGKEILKKELSKNVIRLADLNLKQISAIFEKFNLKGIKELFMQIGEGVIEAGQVSEIIRNIEKKPDSLIKKILRFFFKKFQKKHTLRIEIESETRPLQILKIINVVNELGLKIEKMKCESKKGKYLITRLEIEEIPFITIDKLFDKIEQIDGIISVRRLQPSYLLRFYFWCLLTLFLWIGTPIITDFFQLNKTIEELISKIFIYSGILTLTITVLFIKSIVRSKLNSLKQHNSFWLFSFIIFTFVFIAIISKLMTEALYFNWIVVMGIVTITYSMVIAEYIKYHYYD